jgi:hypothetical protein
MTQTIDHNLREDLGVSPMAYLVLDCYWQLRTEDDVDRAVVEMVTGLAAGQIGFCLKELAALNLYQEEERRFGIAWTSAHSPTASKDLTGLKAIAEELVQFFALKTGRDYRVTNNFVTALRNIIRGLPVADTGAKQMRGVIEWAALTWKEEFKDKVRPQTLFRSPQQYSKYLELARTYWREQSKKQTP